MHILAVHQGNELYGSDRSFISSLKAFRPLASKLTVHLPAKGAISEPIEAIADTVIYDNLGVLRRGQVKQLLGTLPKQILSARKQMQQADCVYINTSVVADYLLAARLAKTPVICHIREIPSDRKTAFILKNILRTAGCTTIYNSRATQQAFAVGKKQFVVYNGVAPSAEAILPMRTPNQLKLLMIGRFNSWKGQDTLLEAVSLCSELNIDVRMSWRCL